MGLILGTRFPSSRAPAPLAAFSVMFLGQSFVALLTLALAVAANPIVVRDSTITIPFAKQVNLTGSATLVQLDQARAKALKEHGSTKSSGKFVVAAASVPVTNTGVSYIASVSFIPALCSQNFIDVLFLGWGW